MSRVQLALNVDDLDAAVDFYRRLFGSEPTKTRPGYANFALSEPPLKLVLIENPGHGGSLNHLGVEVAGTDEVAAAQARLAGEGLATTTEDQVACCYALQDKVWVEDPAGAPWEIYTVLADVEDDTSDVQITGHGGATEPGAGERSDLAVAGCTPGMPCCAG